MTPSTTTLAIAWGLLMLLPEALWSQDKPRVQPVLQAAPKDQSADKTEWKVLCDGKSLKDWKVTQFGGEGTVEAKDGAIVMEQGADLTGIHWTGAALPKRNYEVSLEARRVQGSDFFCGLVFPVGDAHCSFVVGGWGGGVVGLSSVDGNFANENETATYDSFDNNRWYKIRLRVSEKLIQAWIQPVANANEKPREDKRVVNLATAGRKLSLHPAVELSKPFGVSCYSTTAALKNIRIRELTKAEAAQEPEE